MRKQRQMIVRIDGVKVVKPVYALVDDDRLLLVNQRLCVCKQEE